VASITEGWVVSSDPGDMQEVTMTRSLKRQARRWVVQEPARSMEQHSQPLPPSKPIED